MNFLWPEINTIEDADKACKTGAAASFLISIVTAVITGLHMAGVHFIPGWNAYHMLDAGIFAVLGFFIRRHSRLAAASALIVYSYGQILMVKEMGFRLNFVAILMVIYFLNAVRGASRFHSFSRQDQIDFKSAPVSSPALEKESVPKQRKHAIVLVVLVLLVGGIFFISVSMKSKKIVPSPQSMQTQALPIQKTDTAISAAEMTLPSAPRPGDRSFKLKDGRTITGKVLIEDDVYYTVETLTGKQEIVIKEDLAS